MLRTAAGLTAAALTAVGGWVYLWAVWKQTSKTRWSSWLIWTITSITSLATYYGSGARQSIWVPTIYVLTCAAILAVSLYRRSEGGLERIEIMCLAGAAASGLVWWMSGSAVCGQIASVVCEVAAYIPIWMTARQENRLGWLLEVAGSALNLLAVSSLQLGLLLYPLAMMVCNGLVVILMYRPLPVPQVESEDSEHEPDPDDDDVKPEPVPV